MVGRVWVACPAPPAWDLLDNNPVNRRSGVTAALPPTRNESFPNLVISLAVLSATLMIPSTEPDDKHKGTLITEHSSLFSRHHAGYLISDQVTEYLSGEHTSLVASGRLSAWGG